MTTLADLKAYDLSAADVAVWVFKTSTADGMPKFNGRWIGITDDLADELSSATQANLAGITETVDYGILAQNNEGSALLIPADETHAHMITAGVADQTPAKKVKNLQQLANSKFYVVKFVSEDGVLLAVRKTDATWSTRKAKGLIKMVYSDDRLDVDRQPVFTIQPKFDFFVFAGNIFINNKPRFESVLQYREGHEEAFDLLKTEPEFAEIFDDLGPISEFVGSNKIHLRRAVAIQEKGHYKNPSFMKRLKKEHAKMNLNIAFDSKGRIKPTPESCRHIFQALLDHRLDSRLSVLMYDVQNTEQVS